MGTQQHSHIPPAIFVVEDDPRMLTLLRRILRAHAHDHVVIATIRGDELLPLLETRPVALVITDYNLPGLDGLQLAREIKARSPHTAVILISGSLLARSAQPAPGVDAYLEKPFPIDQLLPLVQDSLQRYRRAAEPCP